MKNNVKTDHLSALTELEIIQIQGGGFAYDVGTAIRFAWIYGTEGYGSAVGDWAANQVACD